MLKQLRLQMLPQPDDTTCGPTCLHAAYRYFEDNIALPEVIEQIPMLDDGGTLAVHLGCHALNRGYRATIYTFNLSAFDPTWFPAQRGQSADSDHLTERLRLQMLAKPSPKLRSACRAYIEFLTLGGQIRMEDLTDDLLRSYLRQSLPILTGLSATYLYRCERELPLTCQVDDIRGLPTGHFVVLCGYNEQTRRVQVADPYLPNPLGTEHYYEVELDRLVCSILLGVLTYDANLLVIEPPPKTNS